MANTISIDISVTDISISTISEVIADKLWDSDNIEDLAQNIYDECQLEEREEKLKKMCETILGLFDT